MFHNTNPVKSLAISVALAFLLAGCVHREDEVAQAIVTGERPVAMEGHEPFYAGRIDVKVTLSRGLGRGIRKDRDAGSGTYSAFKHSDGMTEVGNTVPPVTLHLLLTNHDTQPLTVRLLDFVSDLGNFALDPDTLTIAPGETVEPTKMVSNLGVNSDEIPFTVTLKLGSERETRIVKVRNLSIPGAAGP
jgi:hypothetical protein